MKSRSTAVAWVLAALAHGLLLLPAAWLYWSDLAGVPDDGPMPVPMLPAFLFGYRSGDLGVSSWPVTWLLACAAYLVPPALISLRSPRGARDGAMFASALLALAWLQLPAPGAAHADFVPSFNSDSRLTGLLWLFGLTCVGCALGGLGAWLFARRARNL